jgi:MFS superfamily sulfate permease-like transporter
VLVAEAVVLVASLPSHYDAAAALTLVIPLAVLVIVLGWWVWAAKVRSWNRKLP